MLSKRYFLLSILVQNRIYCHNCCSTRSRSVEIYSSNNDVQQPLIIEENNNVNDENNVKNEEKEILNLKDNVSDNLKNKNEQNIEKMLKFIKNDISKSDVDEIIVLLNDINDSNCKDVLKKIYKKLNIDSYLNIIKNGDIIYIFTYNKRFINIIPGIHYFYFEKVKQNNNSYSSNNDIGRIKFYSKIKSDIFKILFDEYLKKGKNLPLETMLKISDNLRINSNYNFKILLKEDKFTDEFYILIDKEKNESKKVINLDSLKNDSNSNYKIIKVYYNKIEFINRVK